MAYTFKIQVFPVNGPDAIVYLEADRGIDAAAEAMGVPVEHVKEDRWASSFDDENFSQFYTRKASLFPCCRILFVD